MISLPSVGQLESTIPLSLASNSSTLSDALANISAEALERLPQPAATDAYSRHILIDTPELLVIAARWRAGARTDLHGHSESAGLYRVVSGAFEEERYVPAGRSLTFSTNILDTSDESFLPKGSFHQLRAIEDSISLHAYAPRPTDTVSDLSDNDRMKIDQVGKR